MLILVINGKKYKYLSKQSEITLKIGKDIEELTKEYKCTCLPEFQKWVLTILCGCSYDEADLVDEVLLAKLIGNHPYFSVDIKVSHHNYIKINRKLYKYICFEPLTVETFGNLDFLAINNDLDELYLSLYQPIKWTNLKYWFRYLITKNYKCITDINYFRYKLALYWYFQYKKDLLIEYGISVENDGIPAEEKPDEYLLNTLEKYGIYHIIMELCQNDYGQQEAWLKRDIKDLFKYLRYMNKKIQIKNQQINNQQ